MSFQNQLENELNQTKTLNGANALRTTKSALVDLFGVLGGLRNRRQEAIEALFANAYLENPDLAMKVLFYGRDIRQGLGERRTSRIIYRYLARFYPKSLAKNLSFMSDYGRWDDLLVLLDTPLKEVALDHICRQVEIDIKSEKPSLLGKWMPSINASSKATRDYAKIIIKNLGWTQKTYRKILADLRQKIGVTEVKMSANTWKEINYARVPSNAMNTYSQAFYEHDQEGFDAYINRVKEGQETINASVLYPYNIVEKILYGGGDRYNEAVKLQWENLPNFLEGDKSNVLVMADVSGSMYGRPMATSIGLAIYFAERSQGSFAGSFMTFSESPALVKIRQGSIYDKVRQLEISGWGMNTDFEKALDVILATALKNKTPQEDLPTSLMAISDMEFDQARTRYGQKSDWTFYEKMKAKYQAHGYQLPEIVFWNVNSLHNAYQTSADYEGVKLASGQSVSVFKAVLNSQSLTPYGFMLEVLGGERYQDICA